MRLRHVPFAAVLLASLAGTGPAAADDPRGDGYGGRPDAEGRPDAVGLLVGARVGLGLGQVMSPFGASFLPEVELGWAPSRRLVLLTSAQYAAPVTEGTIAGDPRLPGDATYAITHHQLILGLSAAWRFGAPEAALRPYLAAGPRLYLERSDVEAGAGAEDFGDNAETATDFGLQVGVGLEYALGPGAFDAELQLGYGPVDGVVLRETNTGSVNLLVGYRLYF